jgi:hypothetical protein
MLLEEMGIRAVEHLTGVRRNTILKLHVRSVSALRRSASARDVSRKSLRTPSAVAAGTPDHMCDVAELLQ